ncbi:VOC family protein [Kitasatospora sp. NPDC002227]|uniref:VOC family protein n=1 Tax=Kitasatospora sp. NPDC002227 TaxID=3154773 RepID=UPI003333F2A1
MLLEARVVAALPVSDLAVAKEWYRAKLGLEPVEEFAGGLIYEAGEGSRFSLFPTGITERGGHTQVAFGVANVAAEVAALRERGVVFEEYDQPGLKTEDGIAVMDGHPGAWFKDCGGNLVGVVQLD